MWDIFDAYAYHLDRKCCADGRKDYGQMWRIIYMYYPDLNNDIPTILNITTSIYDIFPHNLFSPHDYIISECL